MAFYDRDAVMALLAEALRDAPRGTKSALARATGVVPQNVGKWGKREIAPDPDKWPAIERFFGWEEGHIAAAGLQEIDVIDLVRILKERGLSKEDVVRLLEHVEEQAGVLIDDDDAVVVIPLPKPGQPPYEIVIPADQRQAADTGQAAKPAKRTRRRPSPEPNE